MTKDEQIIELIGFYRGVIMDSVESEADPQQWAYLRPRLLKALGHNGLEGRIRALLDLPTGDNK